MKPWIITAAILIIAIVLGLWQLKPAQVIEAEADGAIQNTNSANGMQASSKNVSPNGVSNTNASNDQSSAAQSASPNKQLTGNPHLDQLSPEMKQAIRDKLLFNAPIETTKRPDGSVMMNNNGRVTHMPVAVQMPDGSIQIKEYSYIPEDK